VERFDGFMDDFRIYNRVLTEQEIASIKGSDALVDTSALKVRYNSAPLPELGRHYLAVRTLESSPTIGPSAFGRRSAGRLRRRTHSPRRNRQCSSALFTSRTAHERVDVARPGTILGRAFVRRTGLRVNCL